MIQVIVAVRVVPRQRRPAAEDPRAAVARALWLMEPPPILNIHSSSKSIRSEGSIFSHYESSITDVH